MECDYEPFDEYGDQDAISCANGDYNAFEEQQVFLDNEGGEDYYDPYDDPDENLYDPYDHGWD
jgi:hypothetical protein